MIPIRFFEVLANNNGCYQAYTTFNETQAEYFHAVVSEYVALLETERLTLDVGLRQLEAKTGMGAHVFDDSQRAAAAELNDLLKALHLCEGQLAFFERTVQFQAGCIEWLQAQHLALNQLRFGTGEVIHLPPAHRSLEEGVAFSLGLCASFTRESLEQVRTLRNRVRIQLSVVSPFGLYDSLSRADV
ncbi:MAG: hypothetical protein Q9205_003855 [Flavoplaca limonia]